jgi:CRP/FNR family cyclic AMP-dependent transcriptional regulator
MFSRNASPALSFRTEDVLEHLPISSTTGYSKGQIIYAPETHSNRIYLVVAGKIAISRIGEDGREVLLEIVPSDELFGESAFLNICRRSERAMAPEDSRVMSWAVSDIEDLVTKRPRLAVALLQVLAQRTSDFKRRIESLATDTVELRLARSLLGLSERLGSVEEDGSVRMMAITHEMLSRYVGTSREVVTHYMIQFRKLGYVTYSRRSIRLRQDTLRAALGAESS